MAYTRRILATAFRHFPRRVHPSLAHVHSRNDFTVSTPVSPFPSQIYTLPPSFPGCGFYLPLGLHMSSLRFYSSPPTDGSNKGDYINDATNVLTDGLTEDVVTSVALPAVPASFPGEVAAAAADCSFPVAAFQHLIDHVHTYTGLNWWAAIALTTILVRTSTIPLRIHFLKDDIKRRKLMAELKKLNQEMQNSADPHIKQDYQKNVRALLTKVISHARLFELFIFVFISMSMFLAISNMVKKVPSLKGGGILWFTDLTTPDPMYIFPVLYSLAFLISVERGNPMAKGVKYLYRVIALLLVPFAASFPQAHLCSWISSYLFHLVYITVIKQPAVRKFLGIPW